MKTKYRQRAENIVSAIDIAIKKNDGNLGGNEDVKLLLSGVISAILYLAEVIKEKK